MTCQALFGRQSGHADVQAAAFRSARVPIAEGAMLPDRAIELDSVDAVAAARPRSRREAGAQGEELRFEPTGRAAGRERLLDADLAFTAPLEEHVARGLLHADDVPAAPLRIVPVLDDVAGRHQCQRDAGGAGGCAAISSNSFWPT